MERLVDSLCYPVIHVSAKAKWSASRDTCCRFSEVKTAIAGGLEAHVQDAKLATWMLSKLARTFG